VTLPAAAAATIRAGAGGAGAGEADEHVPLYALHLESFLSAVKHLDRDQPRDVMFRHVDRLPHF